MSYLLNGKYGKFTFEILNSLIQINFLNVVNHRTILLKACRGQLIRIDRHSLFSPSGFCKFNCSPLHGRLALVGRISAHFAPGLSFTSPVLIKKMK